MTQYLPPNLLALFAPREAIAYRAPVEKLLHEKKRPAYTGLADYVQFFEEPTDTPEATRAETRTERRERKRKERTELQAYKIEQGIALWNPTENSKGTHDPYKTLFIARVSYDTTESKLRREFEAFGAIKRIFMVHDVNTKKPRGYAFVEYEREKDMHAAYKRADGMKIDGRRVLVDVERGRTVKGWLPRRFGGGLGNPRKEKTPLGDMPDREHRPYDGGGRGGDDWRSHDIKRERDDRREPRGEPSRGESRSRRSRSKHRSSREPRAVDADRKRSHRDKDRDRDRSKERKERKRERRSRSKDRDRKRDRHERDRAPKSELKQEDATNTNETNGDAAGADAQ